MPYTPVRYPSPVFFQDGSLHVTAICFLLIVLFVADLHHTPPRPVRRLTSSLLDAIPFFNSVNRLIYQELARTVMVLLDLRVDPVYETNYPRKLSALSAPSKFCIP